MATRRLTYTEWLKYVAKHATDDGFKNLSGLAVADVCERLKVTRQRVHQMIEDDTLDAISITTRSGQVAMTLVTEASLERYLDKRTPDRNRQGYFAFTELT